MMGVYFTGDIDPDTNDMRLELVEQSTDGATITSYDWTFPVDWTPVTGNTDPALAIFHDTKEGPDAVLNH